MTDLTTNAPVIIRRPVFGSLKLPNLDIGRALGRILEAYGRALDLAYVQPYTLDKSEPPVVLEGSENGRDPNW